MLLFDRTLWPDSFEETRGDWQAITAYGTGPVRETLERLTAPVWSCRMTYATTREDIATLDAFLEARRGEAEAFWLYSFDIARSHRALACGTGDGSALLFQAPICSVDESWSAAVVKVAGVAQTKGVHWDWTTEEIAAPNRAQILFTAGNAPALGAAVTLDAVGRRLYTVHFTRDSGQVIRISGEDPAFGVEVAVREVSA